jgi:hypothetical protein
MNPIIRYGIQAPDGKVFYWTWNKPSKGSFVTERIFIIRKKQ